MTEVYRETVVYRSKAKGKRLYTGQRLKVNGYIPVRRSKLSQGKRLYTGQRVMVPNNLELFL